MRLRASILAAAAVVAAGVFAAASPRAGGPGDARALAALGERLFMDASLSASGRMSCATCHDPARAFGPPNARAVQLGGPDGSRPGHRAAPSLTYLQSLPPFTEHFFESDDDGDESIDAGPTGGLMWDGRLDRARDQAIVPLLSPFEMANGSATEFAARVRRAPYADTFREVFGPDALDDAAAVLRNAATALETFQQDFTKFYPYDSKYDAFLHGRAELTPAERRGLEAFEDPARGNCARCHPSQPNRLGLPPQFTDYSLVALGLPRNAEIPANSDPGYFDLGLCGPDRLDLQARAEYCGRFRTPSLRNVAKRQVFFHNGVAHDLKRAVAFYAERDVQPERWYPRDASGTVVKFDDLPARYHANVEMEAPFGGTPGGTLPFSSQDVEDIVAFLETLNDGFTLRQ